MNEGTLPGYDDRTGETEFQPARFDEILGQAATIDHLREQVSSDRAGHVLLYGPSGCGKATVGLIYARALLCERAELGPCTAADLCSSCNAILIDDSQSFDQIDGATGSDGEIEDACAKQASSAFWGRGRIVILITRAEALSAAALRILARGVRQRQSGKTYIVTASDPGALPTELTDRLTALPVVPLSFPNRLELLKRAAGALGVEVEAAALPLIAQHAGGIPARLWRDLEASIHQGKITANQVCRVLRLEGGGPIVRYLTAVLEDAPLTKQARILEDWDTSAGEKVAALQGAFAELYRQRLGGFDPEPAVGLGLTGVEKANISERIAAKASQAGLIERDFWHSCIKLWRSAVPTTDHDLFLMVDDFRVLLSADAARRRPEPQRRRAAAMSRSRVENSADEPAAGQTYLTKGQVTGLWDAAAFMVQTQGVYFNARFFLRYDRLGVPRVQAGEFLTELLHEMRLRANRRSDPARADGGRGPFHWLHLHEAGADRTLRTHIILHMPGGMADVEDWVRNRFLKRRHVAPERGGLIYVPPALGMRDPLQRHLALLRLISRGLDPEHRVLSDYQHSVARRPRLIDLLGVPLSMRGGVGVLPDHTRWQASRQIAQGARCRVDQDGLAFLSAMSRGAWRASERGHDWSEWVARCEARKELERVRAEYPADESRHWLAKRRAEEQLVRERWKKQSAERLSTFLKPSG